jgi:V/A-type H+-transporting ATPase subunit I
MVFGLLYGSIFGFEHWIHPLWMSPMSDPVLMLTVALYWGIGFILLVTGLNILNLFTVGRWPEALFDGKGLMGIVLYGSLIAAVYGAAQGGAPMPWLVLAGLALLTVLAYHWQASSRPFAERAVTVVIVGFETLIGYLSGTLSFLRVAAFSLNHVALAAAVFALADMMGTVGHWTTIVLGNVFIIVLEGAIVGIQTMRLEYYEGFSRFFSGDGRAFKPLRLGARVRGA